MELKDRVYMGVVEDITDPDKKGRIKVRVQLLYDNLAIEDIPYAHPISSLNGKEFKIPAIGKIVNILFLTNDIYFPFYLYSENYNENLQQKLSSLNDEIYKDFTALLFDETTQIYMEDEEFTIDQLLNKITINNSSINLEIKDNSQLINLGSNNANQDAVLGSNFFDWFDRFIQELSNPMSYMGNMGAPIIQSPILMQLLQEYPLKKSTFRSNNVKISNNGAIRKLNRKPNTVNNKNDINLVLPNEYNIDYGSPGNTGIPIDNPNLSDKIGELNKEMCEKLKNAAPSDFVPLNKSVTSPTIINGKVFEGIDYLWPGNQNRTRISDLHPTMKPYAVEFIKQFNGFFKTIDRDFDITMEITSGYRSIAKQKELKDAGYPAATPGKSYHNYGLAVDVTPKIKNKGGGSSSRLPYLTDLAWSKIGEIGELLGFRWGLNFKNPRPERWHFDMGFGYSTTVLLNRYNSGYLINGGYVNLGPELSANQTEIVKEKSQNTAQSLYESNRKACEEMDRFNSIYSENIATNDKGTYTEGNSANQSDEEENVPKGTNTSTGSETGGGTGDTGAGDTGAGDTGAGDNGDTGSGTGTGTGTGGSGTGTGTGTGTGGTGTGGGIIGGSGSQNFGGQSYNSENQTSANCREKGARIILNHISIAEKTTASDALKNGFDSGYEIPYNFGKDTPSTIIIPGVNDEETSKSVSPITRLTLGEIKKVQVEMLRRGSKSSGMGKYQITNKTLSELQNSLKLNDNTLFTSSLQDKMASTLLEKNGFSKWLNNELTDNEFQNNLAMQWSTLPNTSGRSEQNDSLGLTSNQIKNMFSDSKKKVNNCS